MNRVSQIFITCIFSTLICSAQQSITLPNGWQLSPAGHSFPLGDLPLNIAVSPSKKLMAVTNNGQSTQSIQLIDVATEKIISSIIIAKSWLGLAFSSDEKNAVRQRGQRQPDLNVPHH